MNKKKINDFLQKLKDKLKELFQFKFSAGDDFQFDSSELDFGIYRIMNYKREEIEKFIESDLIKEVEKEFEKYITQSYKELIEKVEEKKRKIKEDFGDYIFTNGKLKEKYGETKLVREYLELKKQTADTDITESIQSQTFNDLYNFFSRYYEDGDFISKRRYSSKNYKYAIPYNGEEVKLYWANFDQYYIKTGEVFKDYVFNQKGWRFIFKTALAEVEAGNVKGERRYFFLSPNESINIKDNICLIKFEYRPLIEQDFTDYPVKTKAGALKKTGITQYDLIAILKDKIINSINLPESKKLLLEKQEGKTILEKHLYKFTRKITSDFFIHKDLKSFLDRELDYFIKTEVLDIDSLDTEKERYFNRHITRTKVVRNISKKIIEFLAQIENFQKMLWEKKKFILKTEYVITIDRIPEEFHPEIINNKVQLKEWEELRFGEINKKEDLMDKKDLFSTKFKKLPVDTKYFNQDFKERLLGKLSEKDNLDDLIDGVLIKSENWQALNLLLEKYKEKIQCIYIDPPFNTGSDFLYKDRYQNSSWITLMSNRLDIAKELLENSGNIYLHLDENAHYYGRFILNFIFGNNNFQRDIMWNTGENISGFKSRAQNWIRQHDVILNYSKSEKRFFRKLWKPIDNSSINIGWLDIIGNKEEDALFIERWENNNFCTESIRDIKVKPLGSVWNDIYSFQYSEPRITESFGFGTQKPENLIRRFVQSSTKPQEIILDFFVGSGTTLAVAHKLNRKWLGIEMGIYFNEFYTATQEVKKAHVNNYNIINIIKENKDSLIANVINIGILGRLKIVLYGDQYYKIFKRNRGTHLSKDINWLGGGFFKYQYLEQYEDTLHNIEFPQEEKGQRILSLLPEEEKSEYLMKYMLKFEAEGSHSLLNLKQFTNPFEYKLKIISGNKAEEIVNVDLIETFNYLIGLKINKYRYLTNNGRKYVFVFGEKNYRKVAIVWRSTLDIYLEKDKKIINEIINDFNPEEIYINGDSLVKNYKPIESEFKSRAGV